MDECQDINAAQDAILNAVRRHSAKASGPDVAGCASEGRLDDFPASHRFLVGDVKQSIYQFRLARPELFRDCERAWKDGAGGRRIPLSENFRSAPGIIRFVNALFQPLMRDDVGGVEYEELVAGRVDGLATGNSASNRAEPPEGVKTGTVQDCEEFHLIPKMDPDQARGEDEAEDGGEV